MKKIIIGLSVLTFAVIISIFSFSHKQDKINSLAKMLELGQAYLLEMNYDEALAAFLLAIDIDNKSVEAYLGAADSYIGLRQFDEAINLLENIVNNIESNEIKDKISVAVELKNEASNTANKSEKKLLGTDETDKTNNTDSTKQNRDYLAENAGPVTKMEAGEVTNDSNSSINVVDTSVTRDASETQPTSVTAPPSANVPTTTSQETNPVASTSNTQTVSQDINTTLSGDGSGRTISEVIQQADQTHSQDMNVIVDEAAKAEEEEAIRRQQEANAAAEAMKAEAERLANASQEELAEYLKNMLDSQKQ